MPIRAVKQYSDRGSFSEPQEQPTKSELRLKKLFEFAQNTKNVDLQSALGFITTDYIADKNALPLSVYRIRQVVDDIKSKSTDSINQFAQELQDHISNELSSETVDYLNNKRAIKKSASVRRPPSFWRVSK